jgi:hypothetical protein
MRDGIDHGLERLVVGKNEVVRRGPHEAEDRGPEQDARNQLAE